MSEDCVHYWTIKPTGEGTCAKCAATRTFVTEYEDARRAHYGPQGFAPRLTDDDAVAASALLEGDDGN